MMQPHGLAPYASLPEASRGRRYHEPESTTRTLFQRDRDRIIHSTAFRRLQYKTQVFVYHEGDHYRTRLTHSLEVAQIARSICRFLHLNEDLAEALALAHDLGHTPFGHAGEEELDRLMQPLGGFDHNAQTLRILTRLESRYAEFPGLNLTWETLEGVVKHNGPLTAGPGDNGDVPVAVAEYVRLHDLELHTHAGPEAQVAALADDIAYNNHDIDDGLRAGLFAVDDLLEIPLVGPVFAELKQRYPGLGQQQLVHEAVRRLINLMVDDLIAETQRRLADLTPATASEIRAAPATVATFSDEMQAADRALRTFLFENMYRHRRVNRMSDKARRIVSDLFGLYTAQPDSLPPEWAARTDGPHTARTGRRVADFIAGMTDRFAMIEHARHFDPNSKS